MSTLKITITDAARNLSEVINRTAYRGERFILVKGKKPVAQIVPVLSGRKLGELAEMIDSMPRLGEKDLDSFGKHIKKILKTERLRDPWAS